MNWPNPNVETTQLRANDDCCEEASTLSHKFYVPCNQPAVNIVGWQGRNDTPLRMCAMCTDHNIKNRGGVIIKFLNKSATEWPSNPTPTNPLDTKSEDELLMLWDAKKKAIEVAKEEEMDLRKYIVSRAFPAKQEGMNTKELGQGYQLKAGIKYNYNLADNDKVEDCLNRIAKIDNTGAFIADRLVSWKPSFLLSEYRGLVEDKEKGSKSAEAILNIVNEMLEIKEAAPSLEIKAPKVKK